MIKKYLGLALALSLGLVQQSAVGRNATRLTLTAGDGKKYQDVSVYGSSLINGTQYYYLDDKEIDPAKSGSWQPINLKSGGYSYVSYMGLKKGDSWRALTPEEWEASFKAGSNGDNNARAFKITGGDTSCFTFFRPSERYTLIAGDGTQFDGIELIGRVGVSNKFGNQQTFSFSDKMFGIVAAQIPDCAKIPDWLPIKLKIDSAADDTYIGLIKLDGISQLTAKEWAASFKAGVKGDQNAIVFRITKGDTSNKYLSFFIPAELYTLTAGDGKQFARIGFSKASDTYYLTGSKEISSGGGVWRPIKLKIGGATYDPYVGLILKKDKAQNVAQELKAKEWAASFKAGAKGNKNAIVFKITNGDTSSLKFVTPE